MCGLQAPFGTEVPGPQGRGIASSRGPSPAGEGRVRIEKQRVGVRSAQPCCPVLNLLGISGFAVPLENQGETC